MTKFTRLKPKEVKMIQKYIGQDQSWIMFRGTVTVKRQQGKPVLAGIIKPNQTQFTKTGIIALVGGTIYFTATTGATLWTGAKTVLTLTDITNKGHMPIKGLSAPEFSVLSNKTGQIKANYDRGNEEFFIYSYPEDHDVLQELCKIISAG